MTTALLADDEPLLLIELRLLLEEAWPELKIVACANTGVQARRMFDEFRPDIVFLDIRMPGIDGLELARLVTVHPRMEFFRRKPAVTEATWRIDRPTRPFPILASSSGFSY